jgi:hypothetical protein
MAGSARCVPRLREGRLFETAALRLPQSLPQRRPGMTYFLNAINNVRHVRSAEGASRTTHGGRAAPGFRFETNSFTRSFAGKAAEGRSEL